MQIHIAGSIAGAPVTEDAIRRTLERPLAINDDNGFIGRTGTRLCVSDSHVIKIKNDFAMARAQAEAWCARQLANERPLGLYHASRTWFAFGTEEGGYATANATRRLPTLAAAIAGGAPAGPLLLQLVRFYFAFYREHGRRQDEGLTNYGIDGDQLVYLDDDLYPVDSGLSFAVSLAGFCRALPSLGSTEAYLLGKALFAEMAALDRNGPEMFARQLRDTFLPPDKEPLRQALLKGLARPQALRAAAAPSPVASGRLAVLADIHANRGALEAVLDDMARNGLAAALVLGDVVGYGPDPGWCVDALRERGFAVIRGNHDESAALGRTGAGYNRAAGWSVPWTHAQLDAAQRQWLGSLPLSLREPDFLAVHGAPVDPAFMYAYVYAMTSDANLDYLQAQGIPLCFHGHTHLPGCWYRERSGLSGFLAPEARRQARAVARLVCPGSVGQPRDGSEAATYAIYDRASGDISWRQVPYDTDALRARLRELGFPDFLQRLFAPPSR